MMVEDGRRASGDRDALWDALPEVLAASGAEVAES